MEKLCLVFWITDAESLCVPLSRNNTLDMLAQLEFLGLEQSRVIKRYLQSNIAHGHASNTKQLIQSNIDPRATKECDVDSQKKKCELTSHGQAAVLPT